MHLPLLPSSILIALALHSGISIAADEKVVEPCTVASTNGAFYDLRPLSILPPQDGKKAGKKDKVDDYHAKGYDMPYNFTLNVCAPLVEYQEDLVGVQKSLWKNASAYYEVGDKKYSMGFV